MRGACPRAGLCNCAETGQQEARLLGSFKAQPSRALQRPGNRDLRCQGGVINGLSTVTTHQDFGMVASKESPLSDTTRKPLAKLPWSPCHRAPLAVLLIPPGVPTVALASANSSAASSHLLSPANHGAPHTHSLFIHPKLNKNLISSPFKPLISSTSLKHLSQFSPR